MTHLKILSAALAALLLATQVAQAQDVFVKPSAPRPAAPAAPAPAAAPPQVNIVAPPGVTVSGESAPAEEKGVYFYPETYQGDRYISNTPPETHTVRRGDTLWDICGYYFGNPWEWPRVWAQNPSITNPHWIYPGDVVRLGAGSSEPANDPVPAADPPPTAMARTAPRAARRTIDLRQTVFIDEDELAYAGTITGGRGENTMMSIGDEVYLEYPDGKPPQVGQRYAIYEKPRPIKHPTNGERIGAYIRVVGEVRILEVKKDRRARGEVTMSNDVISRSLRVGPVRTQFREVPPVAAGRDLEGQVVALLASDDMSGERQIVILDRGSEQGLVVGNRMRVLRRGDGKLPLGKATHAGQDDREFPDAERGWLIVVEVGKNASIALLVDTQREVEVGDHVLMREGE